MVRSFLLLLGGPKAIADLVTVMSGSTLKPKAVSQWGYENAVPYRWRPYLAKLAKQKRIKDVPPEIKGYMQ